jgi:mannosyltransferase OCH1-like enzyme
MFRQHNNGAYMSAVRLAIPRVIHQTFYRKQLPESIRQNIAHLKGQNPSFELRLYDDADAKDFIRDEFVTAILERFLRIRPEYGAARADLFRYLLIYARGGVYLHVKSTTTRPLEEVLRPNDRFLLSHWANRPGEEHEGWVTRMCAIPGCRKASFSSGT